MRNLTTITVLLTLLVLAGLGWGVYWFVGAGATERGLNAWLAARQAEGWVASAARVETNGFPNRFDTTFEALDLDDPETGVGWTAPLFQILSLSYRPTEVIAVWPGAQELRLPGEMLAVNSERMIGSLALGPSAALPLRRLVIEADAVEIASTLDWTAEVDGGQLALRESPGAEGGPVYDAALSLDGFVPDSAELARLRDLVGLPEAVETVRAELTVTFDKGWDITALEDRRPQPREIAVTRLDARWGELALAGTGQIAVDENGVGTGELVLEATNWRDIVALAEASGALPANRAPLVRAALETLAGVSGDPDRLDVTLRFSGGFLLLGPVPVGAAPRFSLP